MLSCLLHQMPESYLGDQSRISEHWILVQNLDYGVCGTLGWHGNVEACESIMPMKPSYGGKFSQRSGEILPGVMALTPLGCYTLLLQFSALQHSNLFRLRTRNGGVETETLSAGLRGNIYFLLFSPAYYHRYCRFDSLPGIASQLRIILH